MAVQRFSVLGGYLIAARRGNGLYELAATVRVALAPAQRWRRLLDFSVVGLSKQAVKQRALTV